MIQSVKSMDRGGATVNWWLPGEGELVFFRDVVPRSPVTRVHTGNRKLGGGSGGGDRRVGIEEKGNEVELLKE